MEGLERNSAAAALLSLQLLHDSKTRRRDSIVQPIVQQINQILPVELLASCFLHLTSFRDMAMVSQACKKWRSAMKQSLAYRKKLSFAGCRVDDSSVARLVSHTINLVELDLSAGRWGCQVTDAALVAVANSSCCPNLKSISLWGVTAITDDGVLQLVSRAKSLENLNVGGTFITDVSLVTLSARCKSLKASYKLFSRAVLDRFLGRIQVLNVWGCKYVSEQGLLHLAQGCLKLELMNVWGVRVSQAFLNSVAEFNAQLQVKPSKCSISSPGGVQDF